MRRFYRFYQTKDMSNAMFLENFQTLVSVVGDYGGTIGTDPKGAKAELIKEGTDVDNTSDASKRKAMETAKKQVPGNGHADRCRCGTIQPPSRGP
jgi:hypothetical protein